MDRGSRFLKSIGLVGLGAIGAVGLSRVHVSFGPNAAAAAPPGVGTTVASVQPALPPPTAAQIADTRAVSRTFVQVAEQLKPSVVSIIVERGGRQRVQPSQP